MFLAINTEQALLSIKNQNAWTEKNLSALYLMYIKDFEGKSFKTVRLLLEISNDKIERDLKVILPIFHSQCRNFFNAINRWLFSFHRYFPHKTQIILIIGRTLSLEI